MHTEDDLLPISALQHLLFCERQTALIHIERQWEENRFTAEGRVLHKKADAARSETRDGVRITRGLQVHSFVLGLYGVCDVVTFQPPEFEVRPKMPLPKRINAELEKLENQQRDRRSLTNPVVVQQRDNPIPGISVAAFEHWKITPVEYKRGKPKANDCDRVQLCAQAICLEEMLKTQIARGDLFYGRQQRRTEVSFDQELRDTTRRTAARLHALIRSQMTPVAVREKKCEACSLLSVCLPPTAADSRASEYLARMLME